MNGTIEIRERLNKAIPYKLNQKQETLDLYLLELNDDHTLLYVLSNNCKYFWTNDNFLVEI